ncbi:hypothetical protein Cgig2_001351 [Carnegiea gigantea]|uniref:NTP pyrophosphohydrolase MazG-like domain-containing protein n=1 Tax=Carnegiea gigantea TaxID=171969 RepID=A0A9Q1KV95_9CARY|nr:hypothetical protein Cgig2_001351 [Carnegiea gigantea]
MGEAEGSKKPKMEERESVSLDDLKAKMAEFAKERDWDQFHTPRNLLLALVGEVGELSEIFQWKGEVPRGLPGWGEEEKQHLGEELSDVLLYLVRLSDICGVDLSKAALRKLELNALKYPRFKIKVYMKGKRFLRKKRLFGSRRKYRLLQFSLSNKLEPSRVPVVRLDFDRFND